MLGERSASLGVPGQVDHPKVELVRAKSVAVDAPERLPIELDGEQVGTTPARFAIVPRALRVRVPA